MYNGSEFESHFRYLSKQNIGKMQSIVITKKLKGSDKSLPFFEKCYLVFLSIFIFTFSFYTLLN